MHLGNGAITTECAALGFAAAAAGVGISWWAGHRELQPAMLLRAVAWGSLVFAAQMLNLPMFGGSSVHFVGGVLLAEILGPALGVLTMSAVLLLQASLLGDGGMAALGINITNMALLPAGCLLLARRAVANRRLALTAASAAAIALAVLFIGGEVALGRTSAELTHWNAFAAALAINHLPLLALEAVATVALIAIWHQREKLAPRSAWHPTAATIAGAAGLIAVAITLSSSLPDGYESAVKTSQMTWLESPQ